ncbi:hypothetical protein [Neorhizobium alkalisoli]|uniref:hypothetical protein n=1 Tax=Neorhizobium alkalisoli TaxID=528178 RepID=UPI00119DA09E|nr:hypothetical protein [Neorhizobium alkalisoli]
MTRSDQRKRHGAFRRRLLALAWQCQVYGFQGNAGRTMLQTAGLACIRRPERQFVHLLTRAHPADQGKQSLFALLGLYTRKALFNKFFLDRASLSAAGLDKAAILAYA